MNKLLPVLGPDKQPIRDTNGNTIPLYYWEVTRTTRLVEEALLTDNTTAIPHLIAGLTPNQIEDVFSTLDHKRRLAAGEIYEDPDTGIIYDSATGEMA